MAELLKIMKPLVSVNWLHQHFEATNLIVLDATLPKVTSKEEEEASEKKVIPNARFFDLKNFFSKQEAKFPNTILSPKEFERRAQLIGINKDSCIVVYDDYGMYSSPRVWWLFKAMGFNNIAVLNGGLPTWVESGYKTETPSKRKFVKGNFLVSYLEGLIFNHEEVLAKIEDNKFQILDARSSGRFYGTEQEPRKEVKKGHIPKSKSLPYSSLINGVELKSKEELQFLFDEVNPDKKAMIFSCGSGITACVLALGAEVIGYKNNTVYDGSWTEWGSLPNLPIEI